MGSAVSYRVRGAYFESCNCDAICPCRMIGGVPGGRSTYGVCNGVLSWRIDEGRVGDVDVAGLATVLVVSYDDDEPGSPWSVLLHIDDRADEPQHEALAQVFLGGLGGAARLEAPVDPQGAAPGRGADEPDRARSRRRRAGCSASAPRSRRGRRSRSRPTSRSRAGSPATTASATSCTRTSSSSTTSRSAWELARELRVRDRLRLRVGVSAPLGDLAPNGPPVPGTKGCRGSWHQTAPWCQVPER